MLSGDLERQIELRVSAGRACPLVDLRVVDTDMRESPHDGASPGEIVVRAPWLTSGYFNNPEASEQLWAGGYLHTDDIGVITPDGHLQITDRIKDVIKSGGEWISSLQLEDIIMRRDGVAECAVIGIKDTRWGERPLALIVRDPKAAPPVDEEDIKSHVITFSDKGVISKFAVPQTSSFRRRARQDERRQVRQEGAARAIRRERYDPLRVAEFPTERRRLIISRNFSSAPTLFAAFLYFDVSFTYGSSRALAVQNADDLHLDPAAQPFPKTPRSEPATKRGESNVKSARYGETVDYDAETAGLRFQLSRELFPRFLLPTVVFALRVFDILPWRGALNGSCGDLSEIFADMGASPDFS